MQFHPNALLATGVAVVILALAINVKLGIAAVIAVAIIDAFSFLTPMGFFQGRDEGSKTKYSK